MLAGNRWVPDGALSISPHRTHKSTLQVQVSQSGKGDALHDGMVCCIHAGMQQVLGLGPSPQIPAGRLLCSLRAVCKQHTSACRGASLMLVANPGVLQALLSLMHGGVLTCAGWQQACQLDIEPRHVPGCLLASGMLKSGSSVMAAAVCWQRRYAWHLKLCFKRLGQRHLHASAPG